MKRRIMKIAFCVNNDSDILLVHRLIENQQKSKLQIKLKPLSNSTVMFEMHFEA